MILSNYLYSYSPRLWLEIFRFGCVVTAQPTGSPGDNSKWVPPDSISNSEVKPLSADDSVGSPHVKVGHRRGITTVSGYNWRPALRNRILFGCGFFLFNDLSMNYFYMANHVTNCLVTILHFAGCA